MSNIAFFQSKNIRDYKEILTGLEPDFEREHWPYLLTWCGVIDNDPGDLGKYWQVWLIETQNQVVGVCGLYSFKHNDNSELWLGWFGVLPPYRGRGIGEEAVRWMEHCGRRAGAGKILSYISPGDQPLKFYQKNGFEDTGGVIEDFYLVVEKKL